MKYFTLLCLTFILIYGKVYAISFDALTHDFGTIYEEKGTVSTTFSFKNKSNKLLVIERIVPACGCSNTHISSRNLAASESGNIVVEFDPSERPGNFDKSIYVYSNDSTVRLSIQGKVIPSKQTIAKMYPYRFQFSRADKNTLSFGTILHTQQSTQYVNFINDSDKPVKLTFLQLPPFISTDSLFYNLLPGNEQIIPFHISVLGHNVWGEKNEKLVVVENGKPSNAIQINVTVNEDFSILSAKERSRMPKIKLSSNEIIFGKTKQPSIETKELTITNIGHGQLLIRKIELTDPALRVTITKTKLNRNKRAQVKISLLSDKSLGEKEHIFNILTNDPIHPVQTIIVKSSIYK